jgi:peptidoglycan hydrolase CwlO-like protein
MDWFNMTKKKQDTLTKRMETMECEVDLTNSKLNSVIRHLDEVEASILKDRTEVNKLRENLATCTMSYDLKVVGGGFLLFVVVVWVFACITSMLLWSC